MLTLTTDQKCALSVSPVDSYGNSAQVDGPPVWTVSDPAVLSLTVDPTGLAASVAALGPAGVCQVVVTADALIGPDVEELKGILDVEVVAGKASTLSVVAGKPEAK